jgi:hypothetical protein
MPIVMPRISFGRKVIYYLGLPFVVVYAFLTSL